MKRALAFSILLATGCASTGIVPMDGDTYMISKRSAQVGFGPPVAAKAEIYKQANTFCAAKGQKVETVKYEGIDSGFGRPASASLQFRCVR